ncbi:MAG: hypothetical protein IPN34_26385 [Planctomycetes bacterium]|nr:hypothetical protein [Planctomycetota bacterium]
MRTLSVAALALSVAATVSAQATWPAALHALPGQSSSVAVNGGSLLYAVQFLNQPGAILGGSLTTNKTSLLQSSNPLALAATETIVVDETLPGGGGRYHGLGVDGAWVPIDLSSSGLTVNTTPEEMAYIVESGAVHVFNIWRRSWLSIATSHPSPTVVSSNYDIVVIDNDRLVAVSPFYGNSVVFQVPGGGVGTYVLGSGSSGRAALAFEIGTNDYAIFSAFTNEWRTLNFATPVSSLSVEYDENHLAIFDFAANRGTFFSALNSSASSHVFANLSLVVQGDPLNAIEPSYDFEDAVAVLLDRTAGQLVVYRPVDNTILTRAASASAEIVSDNDFGGILDGSSVALMSGVARGAHWAVQDLGTTAPLGTDANDAVFLAANATTVFGYSALTHAWTQRAYSGIFGGVNAQDFLGIVETSSEILAFASRTGSWAARPVGGMTSVDDDDGLLVVLEPMPGGTQAYAFGAESSAFVASFLPGTIGTSGIEDSLYYAVLADAQGQQTLHFYSRMVDGWASRPLVGTIQQVSAFDEGLLLELLDQSRVSLVSFMALPDLASQLMNPVDSRPYHAVINMPARFVSSGPAFAADFLIVGVARFTPALAIPGIGGELVVDLTQPHVILPAGNLDAQGTTVFQLQLPAFPGTVFLQHLSLDGNLQLALSRGLRFQIH